MAAGASYDWTLQLGFSGQAPSVFDCTAGVLRRVGDWPKGMPDLHVCQPQGFPQDRGPILLEVESCARQAGIRP